MKTGILITSVSNFGQKGFYNAQEVGLAKAMAEIFQSVAVYKLVPEDQQEQTEALGERAVIHFIPARHFGINGVMDVSRLDPELDALIHFSDTQFSVPGVYRWCTAHQVRYVPYIGVTESHSTSGLKKLITNYNFRRNLAVYRKCTCCVKTPAVREALNRLGITRTLVTPVGLDTDLMHRDYESADPGALKEKYGFGREDRVFLFIGRMIDEKRPVDMIRIFSRAAQKDPACRLLMVGTGVLQEDVKKAVAELGLGDRVRLIDRISNGDIWELYRAAEAFVNLNRQEIFGMAILEAMYYGCKVLACHAPGPDYIIENGISGHLAESDGEIAALMLESGAVSQASHRRIMEHFRWNNMAGQVQRLLAGTPER